MTQFADPDDARDPDFADHFDRVERVQRKQERFATLSTTEIQKRPTVAPKAQAA